ncbi:MAG TPA: type II toxin-antitoxin system VapC family toxin [Rhizomicrobium sp.]|nr:type II toxin-antitoxin system VapC family toxin [Rhizomicrobium sp.]
MGSLSIYLDTSVVVPIFLQDIFVSRANAFLATGPASLMVSDLVAVEFASVVGIRVRIGVLSRVEAVAAFATFDDWISRRTRRAQMTPDDIRAAGLMLRRLDFNLRAPDAINIVIAQRIGAELATFDVRMADCARALGVAVPAI